MTKTTGGNRLSQRSMNFSQMNCQSFVSSLLFAMAICAAPLDASEKPKRKILIFTKSSGYEHTVISWKNGRPRHAEKVLLGLGGKHGWNFEFCKDGSKFKRDCLAALDTVVFYTTGNLMEPGTDGNPPMKAEGKQVLFEFVRIGRGFVGTHSARDTFHTNNEHKKGPDRYINHGLQADSYVRFLGGDFIKHGAQQEARNAVENVAFPGLGTAGKEYSFVKEWYSLKDFSPDIHVSSFMNNPPLNGKEYQRPPYHSTRARREVGGRIFYTAMGHREDVFPHPIFQSILVGALEWASGDVKADIFPNFKQAAPHALTNPPFVEPTPPKSPPK